MAVPKTLTSGIQELISAIGGLDRTQIKAALVKLARVAEAQESGAATRKANAKIARLETALEKAETVQEESATALEQSNAEIGNLKGELQTMQAEIEAFRAEQKEREKKDADLPNEQVELLRILQPKSLGMMQLSEILESISLREDEAVWHLGQLKKLTLADFSHHSIGYEIWYRTELGNAQVIARRLADRGDLPDIAEKILAELSPPGRAPGRADLTAAGIAFLFSITEDLALSYLERLRGAGFAIRAYTSKGTLWSRHPDGTEYLKTKRLTGEKARKTASTQTRRPSEGAA